MASLETILGKAVPSNGRSRGGVLKTNEPTGLAAAVAKKAGGLNTNGPTGLMAVAAKGNTKLPKTAAQLEAEAAAARTATNENILAELGIDTIIGSKRKKHKRYNATTDMVEAETTILGG